ncbi:uncharacterized protein EI90DRAFT_3027382 [Cantharellus anzutake]|uniref:uncharacterized protein n=1 Tax=Cantharellus anzutake TaxID=1750568 RepID=UPI001904C066|nr:uncharacterized protein EI90DRAFT_3027382 [Cantharellus anzutake]KAF8343863.1 hypothetical protein EI90DRAFT_3027382 [Cantharellus anzutake]
MLMLGPLSLLSTCFAQLLVLLPVSLVKQTSFMIFFHRRRAITCHSAFKRRTSRSATGLGFGLPRVDCATIAYE